MNSDSKVFVAGHTGLVGSALHRCLQREGFGRIVVRSSKELDLRRQEAVDRFFAEERPQFVFLAAARVGGILANNSYPADFIRDNLQIQSNVIDAAHRHGVRKLLYLGSSCVYPRNAPQPMPEDCLLTGPLERTNEWYAIAKIAGLKMCEAYRQQYGFKSVLVMPTNLYGPEDNFDLQSSHVLPALLRKFHEAKLRGERQVTIWGTGAPRREFMHVDDLADACMYLMRHDDTGELINVGWNEDISIRELADLIAGIVGYSGDLAFDATKPDGTPRKLLDVSRMKARGWEPKIRLADGIASTYEWYRGAAHRSG